MYLAQWASYKYFKKEEFDCQHTGNNLMQHPFMEKLEKSIESKTKKLIKEESDG